MSVPSNKIAVIAGVGNSTGTGGATAREFANAGYSVALISRNPEELKKLAEEINNSKLGGTAAPFPVNSYNAEDLKGAFKSIKEQWLNGQIRVAVWNAAQWSWKGFLDITEEDIQKSIEANIVGPFAFSREVISTFKGLDIQPENGARGTLIFTSATAAWRGNTHTSAFAAGKHAQRALAQSLNKEFGKDNIHVANAIIDGVIVTDVTTSRFPGDTSEDKRLRPASIAKSYLYLVQQDRSAWTFELDLRPAHEKW
jgi:NAD(P)-dependent dehydrogenase (short-subunit alcohol dehydrogenase family)